MIDEHLKTLQQKMHGLEQRLFVTKENLSADKIIALAGDYQKTAQITAFLMQIKEIREIRENMKKQAVKTEAKMEIVESEEAKSDMAPAV